MAIADIDNKNTILIVDDNATNLGVLFEYLMAKGFKVLVAQSGEDALNLLDEVLPDMILLDILMPGIDGFETCRQIKTRTATADIPIIFMTAVSDTIDKVKGFDLGAVDYITKPFQHEEVLARVETQLTLQRLKKRLQKKNDELAEANRNLEKLLSEKTSQLIQQEKSAIIGRMLQGIIHNLKTPLAVIKNSTSVIRRKMTKLKNAGAYEQLNDKCASMLASMAEDTETVTRAYAHIITIVDNLMAKSRMDQEEDFANININKLLEQELAFFKANAQFKHNTKKIVDFDTVIEAQPMIYTNVAQVVENLIHNALDAMWNADTQQLTITTRQDEKNIYVDISDTGMGIPADKINKIFTPFYTTKPARGDEQTGEPTGTGLGLHTCVELLKPLNGRLSVTSEPGKGSTFTIELPKQIGS